LALGKAVGLELDIQQRDQFGRMLAYVWPEGSMLMLNEQLAAEGYALPLTVPPNVRHTEQFRQAAATAREHSLGLWSGCQVDGAPTEAAAYEGTIEDQVAEASAPPPVPASAPGAPTTPTPATPTPAASTPAPTPTPDFGPRCSDILASTPNRGGPTIDQQWGICMGLGEKHGASGVDCYARATQKTAALIGKISTETHNALFDAELTVCTASIR
jgi:hypothetical protein